MEAAAKAAGGSEAAATAAAGSEAEATGAGAKEAALSQHLSGGSGECEDKLVPVLQGQREVAGVAERRGDLPVRRRIRIVALQSCRQHDSVQ
eukprot:4092051-Prymnesium_polylepis.1